MMVVLDYLPKRKSGADISELFTKHIRTVQTCQRCTGMTPASDHILQGPPVTCISFCQQCWDAKDLCEDCTVTNESISVRRSTDDAHRPTRTHSTLTPDRETGRMGGCTASNKPKTLYHQTSTQNQTYNHIQRKHAAAQLPFSLRETVAARSNWYLA